MGDEALGSPKWMIYNMLGVIEQVMNGINIGSRNMQRGR